MFLQLTSWAHVLAPSLFPRARHVATSAVVLQMNFQLTSRHCKVTVRVIRTHDGQFVQYSPHQETRRLDISLSYRLFVRGASSLHPEVALEANVAEGVSARRVDGVHERLVADPAQYIIVEVVWIVVEMVLARYVALPAAIAHDDVAHALDFETV